MAKKAKTAKKKKAAPKKKPLVKKSAKKIAKKKIKKPAKKKKAIPPAKKNLGELGAKIGKVTHYFDKIKVAAIRISNTLSVGDTIRIKGGEGTDFKQKITSMQLMGQKITKGKKGQEIGIKVKERARDGYLVFRV
ncbi:MAG: hypothetical protein PHG23_03330 [Candidatus Pacebacteria bacterium]|nr:hypothetical protein [Candidatus Paceibacterota bacterium]